MGKRAVISIDIGGTKTLCGLITSKYKLVDHKKFKTDPPGGLSKFLENLRSATRDLLKCAKKDSLEVIGVGVASAGRVNSVDCAIDVSPNIVWLGNFQVGKFFKKEFQFETVVGNDVQLALYGEHELGVAVGCENVLGVFFGTGVGGSAIIHGKIYQGASGMGGQVGSTLTHHIGGPEGLDSHGTLDRIASKSAIAGAALGIGAKQWAPKLFKEVGTDLSKVTWGALSRARKNGDKKIDDLIRVRLRVVGITLSSIVNFLNPEMLVLGGGLTEEMPQLVLSEVECGIREYLVPEVSKVLKVKVAKFKNRAGVFGAAKLAFKRLG